MEVLHSELSCYLSRDLVAKHLRESHPMWDSVPPDQYLIQFHKTTHRTTLLSCLHGCSYEDFRSSTVVEGFGIPCEQLGRGADSVEVVTYVLEELQGLRLPQRDVERIAEFMDQMRSVIRPGTRVVAVAYVSIWVKEYFVWWCPPHGGDVGETDKENVLVSTRYEEGSGSDDPCSICLGEFVEGDEVARTAACSHLFHGDCIGTWLRRKNNCPICRASIYHQPRGFFQSS